MRNILLVYLKDNKKGILLAVLFGVCIIFMPKLSSIGFLLSESLSRHLRVNYAIAIGLSMVGFFNTYLQQAKCEKFTINRAIQAYLSFGFGMAGIYYLVNLYHVGCFSLPSDIVERASIIDFVYFSFVTITTVGYGDIVPRHIFVRILVLIQVLYGFLLILRVSRFKE